MGRPVHFEIHGTDPEKLVAFYGDLFGWTFQRHGQEDYWLASTGDGPGIDGAITTRRGPPPAAGGPVSGATIVMEVQDIDAAWGRGLHLGGKSAMEKMPVPGVGWAAYQIDPDGNVFGIFQNDEEAQ
ncbi:VOC family protein [Sagittula salina]|uniref:VOC family protein n=1 Tax=Sagittula salina TaxID=2820268 RepID=A0A940RZC4_9RHOB|nr:VOC family protein [Sagittula salina]MBP0480981.1 VOC family protein [Sagittula salina]